MFSLLSPLSLWFGAALAVPLMIHFLGRQRLKRQPFPSLLLVHERFSKSMHRHRLKNLLLLIIRTLLILCLLLALGNPALESRIAGSVKNGADRPDLSLALIHNGIYGRLKSVAPDESSVAGSLLSAQGGKAPAGADVLEAQWLRLRALDASEGGLTQTFPVIADGSSAKEVSERYGDYGAAVTRMLSGLGIRPGTAQAHLPVFDWRELASAKGELLRALKENPGLQIIMTDYGATAAKVSAFSGLRATLSPESPTVNVLARLSPAAAEGAAEKVQVSLNGRLFQESAPEGGRVEVTLPLREGPRTVGRFSLSKGGYAAPDLHFCFPQAGQWVLAHAGSDMASLPSLGRESYHRRIVHVASARDVPWTGIAEAAKGPSLKAGAGSGGLRLVYLATERGTQPDAYARAVEFVKRGGRLIIGVGRESDIPLLNRFLLQPLRLGRLGNLVEAPANASVAVNRQALARFGRLPGDAGTLGSVRRRFAFAPDSSVDILLSQGNPSEAVLAAGDFHRGQVMLWTTDIDDLEWSDLGVSPLTPLMHQAFQNASGSADGSAGSADGSAGSADGSVDRAANLAVASDSIYTAVLEGTEGPMTGSAGGAPPEVRDPEGRPFTKVRTEGSRMRIGPFDKLGIHHIIAGKDTMAFAVNLGSREGLDTSPGSREVDWSEANAEARADFLKDFKSYHGRLLVLGMDEPATVKASIRRLWPLFILAAILLLLLEGLISSTFSLRRNQP
ncbi:MAG: BatA domain-containing protein [Fibrobacterota bacterium]|nr:BatA domain-containing protein [Fibrobacterota bacterium]